MHNLAATPLGFQNRASSRAFTGDRESRASSRDGYSASSLSRSFTSSTFCSHARERHLTATGTFLIQLRLICIMIINTLITLLVKRGIGCKIWSAGISIPDASTPSTFSARERAKR
ncbi:hypothetical protein O6H91_04G088300 [Diphasiastrum complanatum]|uniref:Uncharacterized protein n=1 Tax=Diphasiastrum complanatum TaxID=34168 RepID=A0ACC2DZB8_DIPCM|nr:hypothetical protein O6H91_04G088300 [Diphasiastrum complanatum]